MRSDQTSVTKNFITPNPHRSSQPELEKSEIDYLMEKDSSQLYLKDLKTFLGLKRVENKNKEIKTNRIIATKNQIKMQNLYGKKTIYQGVPQRSSEEAEFNLRMVNVY